jgi:hypothetical protein
MFDFKHCQNGVLYPLCPFAINNPEVKGIQKDSLSIRRLQDCRDQQSGFHFRVVWQPRDFSQQYPTEP